MGKTWVYRTHYDGHGLENLFIHCSLDTHSRVGRRCASPVVTLEDRCMHTFEFSRVLWFLFLHANQFAILQFRQKWMDGSFLEFSLFACREGNPGESGFGFSSDVSLRDGAEES